VPNLAGMGQLKEFLKFTGAADRNNGSDLELWKMSQLRKVVKEFKIKRDEKESTRNKIPIPASWNIRKKKSKT
jgi:hypothetical protein